MAKTKVTFKTIRIADDDWKIQADYPDSEQREITGLTSKADADDWMNGDGLTGNDWQTINKYVEFLRPHSDFN